MRHILITGSIGSGKSTFSHVLGQKLKMNVVEFDKIEATGGKRWPDSNDAIMYMNSLKQPHILEGVHVMGFPNDVLEQHSVILLDVPKSVLLERLIHRGVCLDDGRYVAGEEHTVEIEKFLSEILECTESFRQRFNMYISIQNF